MEMKNTYNIPELSAGEAAKELETLYVTAFEAGNLSEMPSVYLCGPMGVGKSTLVKAVAKTLEQKTGKKVCVTDIRLLHFSPVDLRGVPAADAAREFTVWLKPKLFDLDPEVINILFLDELSAAPQSMQAAAYQIALDKCIGEFALPKNCIVICAGNRTTDRSVAFRMPKALANRLIHFEIREEFDSWYQWAVQAEIDPRVIGYLAFDHSRLFAEPQLEELAFPTPRTWEFVSRILKTTGKEPQELHNLIAGAVGITTALEFEAWCRIYRRLPSVDEILEGTFGTPVRDADVAYALISSLITCAKQKGRGMKKEKLENMCRFVGTFPADYGALFFRGLMNIEGMKERLVSCPSFDSWMKKNRQFL